MLAFYVIERGHHARRTVAQLLQMLVIVGGDLLQQLAKCGQPETRFTREIGAAENGRWSWCIRNMVSGQPLLRPVSIC